MGAIIHESYTKIFEHAAGIMDSWADQKQLQYFFFFFFIIKVGNHNS